MAQQHTTMPLYRCALLHVFNRPRWSVLFSILVNEKNVCAVHVYYFPYLPWSCHFCLQYLHCQAVAIGENVKTSTICKARLCDRSKIGLASPAGLKIRCADDCGSGEEKYKMQHSVGHTQCHSMATVPAGCLTCAVVVGDYSFYCVLCISCVWQLPIMFSTFWT